MTLLIVVYFFVCTTVVAVCRSDHLVHELSHRTLRRYHRLLCHSVYQVPHRPQTRRRLRMYPYPEMSTRTFSQCQEIKCCPEKLATTKDNFPIVNAPTYVYVVPTKPRVCNSLEEHREITAFKRPAQLQ